jgi:hypothetical protein
MIMGAGDYFEQQPAAWKSRRDPEMHQTKKGSGGSA